MSNQVGKAYAMNVLTPIRRWRAWVLRFVFKYITWDKSTQQGLIGLSFIHFARWTVVPGDGWPHVDPRQPKDRTRFDYLLFNSNFNGTWDQYIDAFSDVIPRGLNLIWGWGVDFPAKPVVETALPITPFKRYIRHYQIATENYYNAYPGASTSDVKNAIAVKGEIDALLDQAREMSDAEFAAAYTAMLGRVQHRMGAAGTTAMFPVLGDGAKLD